MFRTICIASWVAALIAAMLVSWVNFVHMDKGAVSKVLLTVPFLALWFYALLVQFRPHVMYAALLLAVFVALGVFSLYEPLWASVVWMIVLVAASWLAREEYLDTPHPTCNSLSGVKIPGRGIVMISTANRTPRDINEEIRCYRRNARLCK